MGGVTHEQEPAGVVRVRVRYCECDPMNVAHHASYVPWLELARTELLRERGVSYAKLERDGVLLMVTRMELSFRAPVLYDDEIEIRTTVVHTGKARLRHHYEIRVVSRLDVALNEDPSGERPAASAEVELGCCDKSTGRPMALPAGLRGG